MSAKPIRVGFAGMSHLGLVSAAGAAEKGFSTVGYDPDPALIAALTRGDLPVVEPDLDALVEKNAGLLQFTDDVAALGDCDLVFVARDVPTDDAGQSDLAPIRALVDDLAEALSETAILTLLCQVPPGFTRSIDRSPEKLCYVVETLIFGQAVHRTLQPERFIVGLHEGDAGMPEALAAYLGAYGCPLLPMRYESAELAKISINLFLTASVTTTNTIAEICERVGAEWSEIAPALRLDRRIGPYAYLNPGLGISGGNLERDMATAIALAERHGSDARAIEAYVANSAYRKGWPLRTLAQTVLGEREDARIAVLGLAYKEDSDSVKNSPALELLDALRDFDVVAYDPVVTVDRAWHDGLVEMPTMEAALAGADAAVIMTPWDEFRSLQPEIFVREMRGDVIIDPYRLYDAKVVSSHGLRYHGLGSRPR
ncbi:MAG: nucleotide sugar dehydrogenase [Alphaproteobacteria bacterium]